MTKDFKEKIISIFTEVCSDVRIRFDNANYITVTIYGMLKLEDLKKLTVVKEFCREIFIKAFGSELEVYLYPKNEN